MSYETPIPEDESTGTDDERPANTNAEPQTPEQEAQDAASDTFPQTTTD